MFVIQTSNPQFFNSQSAIGTNIMPVRNELRYSKKTFLTCHFELSKIKDVTGNQFVWYLNISRPRIFFVDPWRLIERSAQIYTLINRILNVCSERTSKYRWRRRIWTLLTWMVRRVKALSSKVETVFTLGIYQLTHRDQCLYVYSYLTLSLWVSNKNGAREKRRLS